MAESSVEQQNQGIAAKVQQPETLHDSYYDDQAGNRDATIQKHSRPSSANKDLQKEREERIKQLKERQNEERQKKLEELKAQALAAQKFREQKEEERRRRMEDLRRRENDRRSQVEERRRAIQEADNERRQYILAKNQEREQRMETKRRNERSSIQFAFGSSTPRMIDTSDSGLCSSFWANRRATSITNVAYTGAPLTRRSSERELTDGNAKKRATSASGLDRSTDGLRSGEITPNSVTTASRPGSAMSSSTTASGVVYRRALPPSAGHQRKPRPISIAVTGVTAAAAAGMKEDKPPLPKPSAVNNTSSISLERKRSQSGTSTPSKPPTAAGDGSSSSARKAPPQSADAKSGSRTGSARATPKASSTPLQSPGPEKAGKTFQGSLKEQQQQQLQKQKKHSAEELKPTSSQELVKEGSTVSAKSMEEKVVELVEIETPAVQEQSVEKEADTVLETITTTATTAATITTTETIDNVEVMQKADAEQAAVAVIESSDPEPPVVTHPVTEQAEVEPKLEQQSRSVVAVDEPEADEGEKKDEMKENSSGLEAMMQNDGTDPMTASMIAKRITTEEEAKAALAERRRLAREEAERQAELERQRIAAEEEAERQRQAEEEERLRKLEEETIRLAEEQRRLEEERLQQAIEEARKRSEEERLRREEEARAKAEREEAERKAREEAERQRIEMAEKLRKEEKEREERRKRVEEIMSRMRSKGSATNTPTKSEDNKENAMSKSQIVTSNTANTMMADGSMSMTESMLGTVEQEEQQEHEEAQQQQQSSETTTTNESTTELIENAVQSLILTDDDGGEGKQHDQQPQQPPAESEQNNNNHNSTTSSDYERSVTEKENLLLGSFNNLKSTSGPESTTSLEPSSLESGSTPTIGAASTNGKSTPGAATVSETTEMIIEDSIMASSGQTNGHKNGSIDNVLLVALVNE